MVLAPMLWCHPLCTRAGVGCAVWVLLEAVEVFVCLEGFLQDAGAPSLQYMHSAASPSFSKPVRPKYLHNAVAWAAVPISDSLLQAMVEEN